MQCFLFYAIWIHFLELWRKSLLNTNKTRFSLHDIQYRKDQALNHVRDWTTENLIFIPKYQIVISLKFIDET